MSEFGAHIRFWGGNCCGSGVYDIDCQGVNLRFDKPWEDGEVGREVVTIETSLGNIYAKFNLDNKYHAISYSRYGLAQIEPLGPNPRNEFGDRIHFYHAGVEHYTCKEIYEDKFPAQVGLMISVDNYDEYIKARDKYRERGLEGQAKIYEDYAELHKDEAKKVRDKLTSDGILLYESQPFYNLTHQIRVKPSLTFFVYDKGLKQ